MSRAILTSYYPGSFFVPLWQRYYSPFFDDVCMIALRSDQRDPEILTDVINHKLPELLKQNDIVMIADIDEIIVPDPVKWRDLGDYLDNFNRKAVRCVGYNVMQMPWEPEFDLDSKITSQRRYWQRDKQYYDKPVITKQAIVYDIGNHQCNLNVKQDPELVMFHLRDADIKRSLERRGLQNNSLTRSNLLWRISKAVMIPENWRII